MIKDKKVPLWVQQREKINNTKLELVEVVGLLGASGIIDGKLPNGEIYQWKKRRK